MFWPLHSALGIFPIDDMTICDSVGGEKKKKTIIKRVFPSLMFEEVLTSRKL